MRVAIFDLDGTLANIDHRLPLIKQAREAGERNGPLHQQFHDACVNDTPIHSVINILHGIYNQYDEVIILTGRPESHRAQTKAWLKQYGINYKTLIMRATGDHRSDAVVKKEVLDVLNRMDKTPSIVFEDRSSCVNMWRDNGIQCLQVAEGDF